MVTKQDILDELDSYFAARGPANEIEARLGPDIKIYHVKGAIERLNNRAEEHDINFYVYKEGQVGIERAYYSGDPINRFWRMKVIDYITIENAWSGRIFMAQNPFAICRLLQDPAIGEKWVLIEETAPDVYSKTDIVGDIITDL